MDTPEKATQIATSLSKFEDSPIFNYINSLSPIKPVKSLPVTQTLNPLSFSSLPSIFTSPHVIAHKETRFLKRNNCLDPSESDLASENSDKVGIKDNIAHDAPQVYENSTLQENFDSGVDTSSDAKFAIELPRALTYDCGSPSSDPNPCDVGVNRVSGMATSTVSLVPSVKEPSQDGRSEAEVHLQRSSQMDGKNEVTGCDWESLISDAAELLTFNFPNYEEDCKSLRQKTLDPEPRYVSFQPRFLRNVSSGEPRVEMVDPVASGCEHEMKCQSSQPGETSILNAISRAQDIFLDDDLDEPFACDPSENMVAAAEMSHLVARKPFSNLHRGIRRRCLDFELVAWRKNLDDASNYSSPVISQSDEKIISEDKQQVSQKPNCDSNRCVVPGIGLHLNALAITSQENKSIRHEYLSSGRQRNLLGSNAFFHSPENKDDPRHESLTSSGNDIDAADKGVPLAEDASQTSAYSAGEDYNQNSPKKKRRRLEIAGENESCKRCNCKKSKCLKLYCECFAAGVYCIEPCSCQDCFNTPIHEDTVLAIRKQIETRNPLAFAPKVIRNSDSPPELGEDTSKTPSSARHKRGCNCKKSSCLKKYCECYQGGVGCSINCRCEGCKNTFGRKDGSTSTLTETEADPEAEEMEMCEKSALDKNLHNDEEQNPGYVLPTTPLQICRPLVELPFSSKCKPLRSLLCIGSSSGFFSGHNYGKPNILRSQPKFENSLLTAPEDEMLDILRGTCTPSSHIKTSSPNSKRVSPPHTILGSSPSRRSGRKLILQSIPSFPSLTPKR